MPVPENLKICHVGRRLTNVVAKMIDIAVRRSGLQVVWWCHGPTRINADRTSRGAESVFTVFLEGTTIDVVPPVITGAVFPWRVNGRRVDGGSCLGPTQYYHTGLVPKTGNRT